MGPGRGWALVHVEFEQQKMARRDLIAPMENIRYDVLIGPVPNQVIQISDSKVDFRSILFQRGLRRSVRLKKS